MEKIPKMPTRIGLAFALNNLRRALWEEALERNFNARIRRQYWEEFREEDKVCCLYCGIRSPERWDHVIPVTKGGATIQGNLVPSCGPCDDSKGKDDLETWLARQKNPRADTILRRILELRNNHRYEAMEAIKSLDLWSVEHADVGQRLHSLVDEIDMLASQLKKK